MKSLLFVHGTGVRRAAYDHTLTVLKREVKRHLSGYEVKECFWGDPYGSKPVFKSVPQGPTQKEIEQAEQITLWQRLLEDPFYQLRVMEATMGPVDSISPFDSPGEVTWKRLQRLNLCDEALAIIAANDLEPYWPHALHRILTETAGGSNISRWKKVVEAARDNLGEMRTAIAHCLIAQMILQAGQLCVLPLTAEDCERLSDLIVDQLGGVDKGLGTLLAKLLFVPALLLANPAIRADRGDFSTEIGPATGDILLYQVRGDDIRDFIQKRIEEESELKPVLVVAHSLGGIAALDLLIAKNLWKHVRALVTVGTQASYLYEIGALWSLKKSDGSKLPDHFPKRRWLNILNRWDFLSYPAHPIFPSHATDREVSGILPFPLSHSAYWKSAETWRAIREFIK
jgi:hypothetical protein